MPNCYLCEEVWTGYLGSYFCDDCERLQKVVKVLGSKKITDNIKWSSNKVVFDREPYHTRSKSSGE